MLQASTVAFTIYIDRVTTKTADLPLSAKDEHRFAAIQVVFANVYI